MCKTAESDVLTGIYADGKWEIGSDSGWDDGFGDIDPEYEEEAIDGEEEFVEE